MDPGLTLFPFFFLTVIVSSVSATEYAVGGVVVGWKIPVFNQDQLYTVWAARRHFYVGDSLRFRYSDDALAIVEKWEFYHCNATNSIAWFNDGNTVVNLDKPGTMYFISAIVDRCQHGVKMILEVNPSSEPVSHPPPPSDQILHPPAASTSTSDTVAEFAVTNSVTALVVGLGLWALKA